MNLLKMSENLTSKTVKNSLWGIIDVLFRQGLNFVLTVVLARLLTPSDYGTVGIMMIFISIFSVFVDSGFASGLIRKLDRTDEDLCTAFLFNIFVGFISYFIVFASSPIISLFFNTPELSFLLRVLALVLIINSFNVVQNAILIYRMKMKKVIEVSVVAQVVTGAIAIVLAYNKFGIWSLIIQQLSSALLTTILLYYATGWKPKLCFSRTSFDYLWSYGSRVLATRIIGNIFGQAYSFVIAKVLGKHELGLFTRSEQFAQQPKNILLNIINKVLFPALSECQNDLNRLQNNYIKCTEVISVIIFPLMISLSLISEPLFLLLFGDKWIEAIPLFRILCIGYAIDIFSQLSSYLIQAMGRSDYGLKLELYKKPVFVIIVTISILYDLIGIVWGVVIYCLVATLINMIVVKSLLHYSYWQQLVDVFKYAILSILTCVPIYAVLLITGLSNILLMSLYCLTAFVCYIIACVLLKVKAVEIINDMIKRIKS